MKRCLPTLLICLLLVTAAGSVFAQPRSDTGRHKVDPPRKEAPEPVREAVPPSEAPGTNPWSYSLSFGGQGGSRVFEVESLIDAPILWDRPAGAPFNARRFEASLERGLNIGVYAGRDLGDWLTMRGSLTYARMDISAEALMGEDGAILLFARPDVYMAGLGGRLRLVRATSHPFLALDLVAVSLTGVGGSRSLDQTNLGYRIGGGYTHRVSPNFKVWAEARFTRCGFDVGTYRPDTPMHTEDQYSLEGDTHLSFFEVLVGLEFRP